MNTIVEYGTIYVLWTGEAEAKPQRVSTIRSIAMLMGGPSTRLHFVRYETDGPAAYWRVTGASALVGFFVARNESRFPARPSEREISFLQRDAQQYARERDVRTSADAIR